MFVMCSTKDIAEVVLVTWFFSRENLSFRKEKIMTKW